jgi:hypothetical protein
MRITTSIGLLAGSLVLGLASPSFAQSYGNAPSAAAMYDRTPTGSINGAYSYRGKTERGSFEAGAASRGLGDVGAGGAPGAGSEGFGSGGE